MAVETNHPMQPMRVSRLAQPQSERFWRPARAAGGGRWPIMRIPVIAAALGIMNLNGVAQALWTAEALTPQEAYTNLLTVQYFACGGVGYAGVTSAGEIAFRSIAATTNALPLFSAAFTNGNAQAKLYALCGIRRFAPGTFDSYADALRIANPEVKTLSGCVIRHEFATNVVARISRGWYDGCFNSPKQ